MNDNEDSLNDSQTKTNRKNTQTSYQLNPTQSRVSDYTYGTIIYIETIVKEPLSYKKK